MQSAPHSTAPALTRMPHRRVGNEVADDVGAILALGVIRWHRRRARRAETHQRPAALGLETCPPVSDPDSSDLMEHHTP